MKKISTLPDKDRFEEMVRARIKMQGEDAHYLETVATHNGINWVNHSMATTVDMTWFALRDIPGPVLLMIGGIDRADDHHKLDQLIGEKVSALICIGSTPWKYFDAFRKSADLIVQARDLQEAIDYAALLARGEIRTVLFSPSCPSYDAFDNYRNRGNYFRKTVQEKFAGNK